MFSRLHWLLLQQVRKVWVRATAFSVLGVLTALIALWVKRYIPEDLPTQIGSDAVDALLGILATSMLSVTIFSLSTMVSAYASATSNVTPRATQLLIEDATAQNALATFIGSFLYSVVGIIVLQTGLYGDAGRVVLYVVTLGVIVLIVATLLRWTDYVLHLGRVRTTTERIERAAREAMRHRQEAPSLGGEMMAEREAVPSDAESIEADTFGYVQHIDVEALQELAEEHDLHVFVGALPGSLVDPSATLGAIQGAASDDVRGRFRKAFTVADTRSFDQDPRFGMCVLSEIASRALSPALNDPGTAIDVLSRGTRLLASWCEASGKAANVRFARVRVPAIEVSDLFDDFFVPIARDGAALVEVAVHVQKALESLSRLDARFASVASTHSRSALARAERALSAPDDRARVQRAASRVQSAAEP